MSADEAHEGGAPDRQGMAMRVLELVRERIREGYYSPGQRLVEAELTREFVVSRGTIRVALGRLEAEGLVEITPHRGAAVRQMTRRDVAEMFRARQILEGGAARIAAERIGDPALRATLTAELEEQRRWTKATDIVGYPEANAQFHQLVLEIADNQLLTALVNQLHTQSWRTLFRGFLSIEGVRTSSGQHLDVGKAILSGDPDRAEAAMRAHIGVTAYDSLTLDHPLFRG